MKQKGHTHIPKRNQSKQTKKQNMEYIYFGQLFLSTALVLILPNAATFNAVIHVVVTSSHMLFLLLLHNCNFATVKNCKRAFAHGTG